MGAKKIVANLVFKFFLIKPKIEIVKNKWKIYLVWCPQKIPQKIPENPRKLASLIISSTSSMYCCK